MDILLTNDDGIYALGLRAMYRALLRAGHTVHVVAPLTEQSAVGHAITLSLPLKIKHLREPDFQGVGVTGTPVDCAKLALSSLLDEPPDVLISGINNGANVGVDILYSGTVSAATEGALAGLPSLAVSMDNFHPANLDDQADYTVRLVQDMDWAALPSRCLLNLNFPDRDLRETLGLRCCPQTQAVYHDRHDHRVDPRGVGYYWLHGEIPAGEVGQDTDRGLLTQGYITLTPLRFDFTDYETMDRLQRTLTAPTVSA
ncbi:5'/3'-nucleotidase SurE [Desulfonatronum sp. SC1]|uniref:5'/3'-nucleotidase SurE n=1 Tax=Desulfonatronum sp. SC1 TaxID=2109626 RepID=UPI000D30720D|nr:5'/3'-nucleotidase SurE [Desulfonatronum sp. SC1]PTN38508.1 5'/3'-nucleotidase SurE [Desulfonatronum sp. SC1]